MDSSDDKGREPSPRRLDSFRLVPVIEFEPSRFSERASPFESGVDDPAVWQAWWKAALGDAGIFDLEPHTPGSWFVAVETIVAPTTLAAMFDAYLRVFEGDSVRELERTIARKPDRALKTMHEYFGALSGGCALVADGETLIEPGCCSDVTNLAEWEAAVRGNDTEWSGLWIGHPSPLTRVVDGWLQLTEVFESERTVMSARWSLDRARVIDELARARVAFDAFADRLRGPVRERLGASDEIGRTIAMHLVGGGVPATP